MIIIEIRIQFKYLIFIKDKISLVQIKKVKHRALFRIVLLNYKAKSKELSMKIIVR